MMTVINPLRHKLNCDNPQCDQAYMPCPNDYYCQICRLPCACRDCAERKRSGFEKPKEV